ncbi:MAG: selenocysteine-specific translation elongation factor [Anaerolineaceae bacterium]|nr:selenocysteine-specific translation elongation factor [Anaerolineaceae bacterium]
MRVIGTAGHVDHGKSTLVRRLTGIDPDRLAEEKAREMTIDLGFAWLELPTGETIGIVDVPGHRDFIENMLAGVGGIDAVLLVIAADEGVMPQTREHLAILDLLGIQSGLIVLTKIDMVDDPDWLELIEQDVRQVVRGTALAEAGIVRVSARTGAGIPELIERVTDMLAGMPPRADYNHPRLPVDRIFTIAGFGTVVTGTLLGGMLRVGQEVEVQPGEVRARVRGLQSYKQTVEVAEPGSRVAVNLSGIEKKAVNRGDVLALPGELQPTILVDVHFQHLPDASRALTHNAQVKFFSGAAETVGYVRLLADEELAPGAEGWAQIRLEKPLALAQKDRFILRYPSPPETIGGGLIVNPHPGRRWKRFRSEIVEQLETRMIGTPAERVALAATNREPIKRAVLQKLVGYTDQDLEAAIQESVAAGQLVVLPDGAFMAADTLMQIQEELRREVNDFHVAYPLRLGVSREELRSRLNLKNATFTMILEHIDGIVSHNDLVRLHDHTVQFNANQEQRIQQLEQVFAAQPFTPPSYTEAAELVSQDVLHALIDLGHIVQVQPEVIFSRSAYDEMVQAVYDLIATHGQITASEVRDRFQTTRKYAIGLLEYLDAQNITRRVGDARVLGRRA